MRFSLLEVPGGCRSAQGPTAIAALTGVPSPRARLLHPKDTPEQAAPQGRRAVPARTPRTSAFPRTLRAGRPPGSALGAPPPQHLPDALGTTALPPRVQHLPILSHPTPPGFSASPRILSSFLTSSASVLGMRTESPRHLLRRSQPPVVILECTPVLLTWAAPQARTRRWRLSNRSPVPPWEPPAHRCPRGQRVAGGGVHRCQKQTRLR